LVGESSHVVLKGCPYINERIIYERHPGEGQLKGLMKFGASLRREDFDIVVDLQNNRTSHILAFLTMADLRYGYDNDKWSFLLNKRVKDAKAPIDPVSHQFRTLNLLGIEYGAETLELWPSAEDEEWADNFLRENWIDERRVLAGINIASSERWQSKRWDADRIAELCDGLARKYDMRTVLTGVAEDMDTAKEVVKLSVSKPIIAVGKTGIMQLASLIGRTMVYVTTDSAPLHIAIGMKVPVVALFGPTDPARHMPMTENAVILRSGMKCGPCYKPFCGKQNNCMRRIKAEDVLAAAEKYLIRDTSHFSMCHSLNKNGMCP
jgi:ADP-heptose:LPS heptosyltransferase